MDREITQRDRITTVLRRLVPAGLIAVALLLALRWGGTLLGPSVQRSRVRIAAVERGDLTAVLTASGVVQPSSDQVISSPIEARVLNVLKQPGSRLEKGEPILELDVGQTTLEVDRLEGRRDQALSQRRELELQLEERLIDLDGQREVRQLEVEEAEYRSRQAQRLFDQGLTSEVQLRETLVRQKKAEIEGKKVEAAIRNRRASAAAQLASSDAQLRTLARELSETRIKAEMAVTRADRSGILTFVVQEEGSAVRQGDVLARIADPDRFRVEATISDVHASRIAEGQPVEVPVGDSTLRGTVARILPAVEQGALAFWVELDDPGNRVLRTNLRTEVLVVVDQRTNVLKLTKGPFATGPGTLPVFVVDGTRAVRRTIKLGLSGHKHYEVLEGLKEGEEVILSDVNRFRDSDEIRLR